jgi:hypothetical protein
VAPPDEGVEAPQKTQTQDAFSEMLKSSQERALAGQRALDARRDQLLNLSQQRMFNPTLMKFAGGMLAPTKTGGFGESLGYAATAAADEQEKEFAREQALAKLQYEMELESAKQKEAAGIPQMLLKMRQERAQPVAAAPTTPSAPAPAVAAPTAPAQAPTVQAPTAQPRPAPPKTLLGDMTEAELQIMMGQPNLKPYADAEMALRKERRESIKMVKFGGEERPMYPEQIQELQALSDSGDMVALEKFYRRFGVPFPYIKDPSHPTGYRIPTDVEKKALEEREKGKYGDQKEYSIPYAGGITKRPFTPFQYVEFMDAQSKGEGDAYIDKLFPKVKSATGATEGDGGYKTKSQEAVEQKIEEERGTKRVTASEATRESLFESSRAARQLIQNSDQIIQLATDPKTKEIFGVFAKPGILNALGTIVAEGARVGNYSISLPSVENAMRKAGATEEEIKAAAVAARIFAQNELGFRRMFLSGQGSVSNMEGAVIPRFSGDLSDSAGAAQAKAEMTKARAELDAAAARALREWEGRSENKKKNFSDFEDSKEYNRLLDGYDAKLKKIMAVHFPGEKFDTKPNRPVGASNKSSVASTPSLQPNQPPGVDMNVVNKFKKKVEGK